MYVSDLIWQNFEQLRSNDHMVCEQQRVELKFFTYRFNVYLSKVVCFFIWEFFYAFMKVWYINYSQI